MQLHPESSSQLCNQGAGANPQAILFDYGMVLSRPADPDAKAALIQICGIHRHTFEKYYWANRLTYDAGQYRGETYWNKIALDAGIALDSEQIRKLIRYDIQMWSIADDEMVDWALKVQRSGFQIGILSNICNEIAETMEREVGWVRRFDYRIWSCRLGVAKPDLAIFKYTVERLGISPDHILYMDDREENIAAARAVGIQGIVYTNKLRLRSDLQQLRIDHLLPPI